jgi:hypothetical protein
MVKVLSHVVPVKGLSLRSAARKGFRYGQDGVRHALVSLAVTERVTLYLVD